MPTAESTTDPLREELRGILKDDYYSLTGKRDEVKSKIADGVFETVHVQSLGARRWSETMDVVTKLPDGRFFQWTWENGLTELQENEGPGEYGAIELTEVFHTQRTVIVDEYAPRS